MGNCSSASATHKSREREIVGSTMGNCSASASATHESREREIVGSTMGNCSSASATHKSREREIVGSTMGNCSASASTSASTADPTLLEGDYEVFLNFCGQDTRHTFTDYLYTSLNSAGVRTFRDDDELRVGEEIGPGLARAINDSKISIPIFSKNYASRKWCLIELAYMVKCLKNGGHRIFLIFLDVKPHDVRNQTGSYEEAFRQHKEERRYNEKTINEWEDALKEVGQLKGLELEKETGGLQGKLAAIITDEVLEILNQNNKHEDSELVGMPSRIEKMEKLLNIHSNDVRFIVIHGMGGLGKTTIANAIYKKYQHLFDYHSFLIDVRETESRNGIVHLQKKLLSDIRKTKNVDIGDYKDGIKKIEDAVCRKNVLIVLDDVDKDFQVDNLAGSWEWFGARARIIITTRDVEVLHTLKRTCHDHPEAYGIYQPGYLNADESLELFSKYAFKSKSPPEDYDTLSKDIASTAAGLPLVLKVTGSSLYDKTDKELWEEKVEKLKNIPEEKVQEKLRLSFDPLTEVEKEIFLDIACLFIGKNKTNPCYMWEDCGFFPKTKLNYLVSRSLITVGCDDILRMHDQLRDLGRQIACEGKLHECGRWSRLWDNGKAFEVYSTGQRRENVKALCLERKGNDRSRGRYPRRLEGEKFRGLQHLRYLTLDNADTLYGDFEHCLPNLRWLRWSEYSFRGTNLHLRNLVILDLSYSSVTEDSQLWSQMSKKLKVLDLSGCDYLRRVPFLSTFSNLETLDVSRCSLRTLPNLSRLMKLKELKVDDCKRITDIPGLDKLESLEHLNMSLCKSFERLPDLSNLKRLKELYASSTILTEIRGLGGLKSLEVLVMSNCACLERVFDLTNLKRLRRLRISYWPKLIEIQGETLEIIDLRNLKNLKKLEICCQTLNEIRGLEELESLELLLMGACKSIEMLPDISNLTKLVVLMATRCKKLTEIRGLEELKSLEYLDITNCKSIKNLPDFSNLRKLKAINASGCEKLTEIRGLENLESFGNLFVWGCKALNTLMYFQVSRIRIHTKTDGDYWEFMNDLATLAIGVNLRDMVMSCLFIFFWSNTFKWPLNL